MVETVEAKDVWVGVEDGLGGYRAVANRVTDIRCRQWIPPFRSPLCVDVTRGWLWAQLPEGSRSSVMHGQTGAVR